MRLMTLKPYCIFQCVVACADAGDATNPLLAYEDVPPLLSVRSTNVVHNSHSQDLPKSTEATLSAMAYISPSTNQQIQSSPLQNQQRMLQVQAAKVPDYVSQQQKELREQQALLLSDIMANQRKQQIFNSQSQRKISTAQAVTVATAPAQGFSISATTAQSCPQLETFEMSIVSHIETKPSPKVFITENVIVPYPQKPSPQNTALQTALLTKSKSPSPLSSPSTPVEIRIPSPVKLDYVPDQADVLISTPRSVRCVLSLRIPHTKKFLKKICIHLSYQQNLVVSVYIFKHILLLLLPVFVCGTDIDLVDLETNFFLFHLL